MKPLLILFIGACLCAAPVAAQDIESTLSGATVSQGFTVKNSSGTGLFSVRGNGWLGVGTLSPTAFVHIQNGANINSIFVEANAVNKSGIYLIQAGIANAARFDINNASSNNNCLEANSIGTGAVLYADSKHAAGTILECRNGTNTRFTLASNGNAQFSGKVGIGIAPSAALLQVENSSSSQYPVIITNDANINALRVTTTSTSASGLYLTQNGTGNASRFDIQNTSSTNNCLEATSSGTGAVLWANSSNASGKIVELMNGSTRRMVVLSNGNVGIGVDAPSQDLDVLNNARFRGVGSGAYSQALNLTNTGVLTIASSDRRLKTNVRPLGPMLDKVLRLQGVRFNWKTEAEGPMKIGFIAQDVEKLVPEVVFTNPTDGYMGINYAELTAVLVEAVKEQHRLIESLNRKSEQVAALEQRVVELEARCDRIRDVEVELASLKALLRERIASPVHNQAVLQVDVGR